MQDLAAIARPVLVTETETGELALALSYAILNVDSTAREDSYAFTVALNNVNSSGPRLSGFTAASSSVLQPGESRDDTFFFAPSPEQLNFTFELVVEAFDDRTDDTAAANNLARFGPFVLDDLDRGVLDNAGPEPGQLRARPGKDIFLLSNDNARDLVIDYDPTTDLLDVSGLGAGSLDDLQLTNLLGGDGSVRWVQISDAEGDAEAIVRFANRDDTDAAALTADKFIFTAGSVTDTAPQTLVEVFDLFGIRTLTGTSAAESFVLLQDSARDVLRDFDVTQDVLDVSAWGATGLDDLTITELVGGGESIRWIAIAGPEGVDEVIVRFLSDQPLSAAALTAERFIFSDTPPPPPEVQIINDAAALDTFRGTDAAETFVFSDDGQRDVLRDFDLGTDKIDVSAWGATGRGDIRTGNLRNNDGDVRWIQIFDTTLEAEIVLRFKPDQRTTDTSLTADDFIFAVA